MGSFKEFLSINSWDRSVTQERTARFAPQVVACAAAVGILLELLQMGMLLRHHRIAPPVGAEITRLPGATTGGSAVFDPGPVVAAHLFGQMVDNSPVDTSQLPAAQANLILTGTIAAGDASGGLAIMGENVQVAKLYRAGTLVSNSVRLRSVYVDRVVIEREGGILEVLYLPNAKSGHELYARLTNAAMGGLQSVASDHTLRSVLNATPIFDSEIESGYRVFPAGGFVGMADFMKLGLQPGDLITAINGAPIQSAERGAQILNSLLNSSSALVSVLRDGKQLQLVLQLS